MLCLSPQEGRAQQRISQPINQNSVFSLSENGVVSVNSDAITPTCEADILLSAAQNSPYVPKAAVFNDKEAPIRIVMEEKVEKDRDVRNWFFLIPDSMMGRMFLSSINMAETPASFQFVQQQVGEAMYSFTLSPDKKHVLLKECSSWMDTDTLDAISKAVDISNSFPIVASLKVDSAGGGIYKVNVTPILLNENYMTITASVKQGYGLSQNDPQRSTVNSIHSYPTNIEIRTTRTYTSARNGSDFTIGLNASLILLPKTPMQRRLSDPRIGIRSISATHFADNQQKVETTSMFTRWRLEPKTAEDAQKQLNGELIEPKKPIVYYIDPAFPAKWIPYIKEGVKEWQSAFEHAGWKNAIYALDWPTNDSTISFEDARYNIIRMSPSLMSYVFGNNRVWDYRSGEFLNTYIFFCQGAMDRIRETYVADCAAADPDARNPVLPDSLMGALIRHSIAKAVAPTIGLLENHLASSLTPTDSLRSKAFVQKYSISPSITDELPYNYVAQPGDGLTRDELIPRVSDGDEWTVMIGYKNFGFTDPEQERQHISQIITDSLSANPRLAYATKGSGGVNDPLCKVRDLGDDQAQAVSYMLDNMQRILPTMASWGQTVTDFQNLNATIAGYWTAIRSETTYAQNILANNFTGTRYAPRPAGVSGSKYYFGSKEYLEKCLDVYISLFGKRTAWLYPESYAHLFNYSLPEQAGIGNSTMLPMEMHAIMLYHLNPNFDRIEFGQRVYDACMNHSPAEFSKDIYLRAQQSALIAVLLQNMNYNVESFPQMGPVTRPITIYFLHKAQTDLQKALASAPDELTRNHFNMLLQQVHDALEVE